MKRMNTTDENRLFDSFTYKPNRRPTAIDDDDDDNVHISRQMILRGTKQLNNYQTNVSNVYINSNNQFFMFASEYANASSETCDSTLNSSTNVFSLRAPKIGQKWSLILQFLLNRMASSLRVFVYPKTTSTIIPVENNRERRIKVDFSQKTVNPRQFLCRRSTSSTAMRETYRRKMIIISRCRCDNFYSIFSHKQITHTDKQSVESHLNECKLLFG